MVHVMPFEHLFEYHTPTPRHLVKWYFAQSRGGQTQNQTGQALEENCPGKRAYLNSYEDRCANSRADVSVVAISLSGEKSPYLRDLRTITSSAKSPIGTTMSVTANQ